MGLGDLLAGMGGEKTLDLQPGVVKSIDWANGLVIVNVAAGEMPVLMAGDPPIVGLPVWVLRVGDRAITLGRPSLPAMGTVTAAPVNGFVNVKGDDGLDYVLPYPFGATLASGNRVALDWSTLGRVEQRVTGEITPTGRTSFVPPPDAPAGGDDTGGGGVRRESRRFEMQRTRTWNAANGWAKPDVWFAQGNVGAWFYGTQIADTIPDNARITGIRMYLECIQSSGQTIKLGTHTYTGIPGSGSIPISNHTDLGPAVAAGFKGEVALPLAFGDALKTGAAFGLGVSGPGYRILKGEPLGSSGALTIDWEVN